MANQANPCPCDIGDRLEYEGLGQEVQIEHTNGYVVRPSAPSDKAIIVIHDIYGWHLPNTRYMADLLAANGYIAVCADFYPGKGSWNPSDPWDKFQEWLADRLPTNINKEVDAILRYLKEQCGAKHVGVIGFCWGGAATHYLASNYSEIKAGVSFYGIIRNIDDNSAMLKSPTLYIYAENDDYIPLDKVKALEAKLKEKCSVDYQLKIFPGQTHGFAHRKREDVNPQDKSSIQEARTDMLNWLNKYM
ncbi:carboxymethylenebutenolidase homolog [Salarias fasciatus]|nr:carboxymethylenebutenolidase homolog [Salarias fasciatus]